MSEIRSFRAVFDLERRIYRIDRLRLNPSGVPVRGVVYFLALLALALAAGGLPLAGALARLAPWYLRDLALPALVAALFTAIAVEGRPFHLAALALARYALGRRELAGLRPRTARDRRLLPGELLLLADGSDAHLRALRYRGPGAVRVRAAHVCSVSHRGLPRARARPRGAPVPSGRGGMRAGLPRARARGVPVPSGRVAIRAGRLHARPRGVVLTLAPLPSERPPAIGRVIELGPGASLRVRSRS